jgi:hypothetical protein
MILIVLSIVVKLSIAYSNEKEGIAINNKIIHGIRVQIISKDVLCWQLTGNNSKLFLIIFLFEKANRELLLILLENKFKISIILTPELIKLINKYETKTTIQIKKNIIS